MSMNKVIRMKQIFESSEMAQKFLNISPEKMIKFSDHLSEIRFDSQVKECIRENNVERYQGLMKVALDIHPLKDDSLFSEAWNLACDPEVIIYAWEEERKKAS